MPGEQNRGWHQPQQFQGPRPDNKGLRIGLVVLVGVLTAAAVTWSPPLAAHFQARKGQQPYRPPRTR